MTTAGRVHAFADDALGHGDATEVAERVRSGVVSAAEVCAAAIERAERMQPLLSAVAVTDHERALAAAGVRRRGPFAGVPTYVKDNDDVAGLPTSQGSDAFTPSAARTDSPFVVQLKSTGPTVVGKSRLPEFGFNATTEFRSAGPVHNPWALARSAGGSSGGAAALVAAGVVPLAHANDGGGSTRIPAAACGLVGLKPTRGRLVPDPLERILPVGVVTEGVLTRSVRDTARFYAAAERAWRNPHLPPVRLVEGPSRTRLRVGVVLDGLTGVPVDAQTRGCVLATAELLADLGHEVAERPNPADPRFGEDFALYWGLLALAVVRAGARMFGPDFDASRTDNLTHGLAQMCRRGLVRVPGMVRRLRSTTRTYRAAFEDVDVLLSPTVGHPAPLLGHLAPTLPFDVLYQRLEAYVGFTPFHNTAGGPAASLPAGLTSEGMPIGCQLSADLGDERTLLELAFEIEQARPWPRITDVPAEPGSSDTARAW